jgi:hypothetical protein
MPDKKKDNDNDKSFWQTLPGIITAITGLIVAITGLVTVLGEQGVIGPTPTAFSTITPVDVDATLPAPVAATHEPTEITASAPVCRAYTEYEDKVNPNAVLLAFTDSEMWVQYGGIDESVASQDSLTAYIFDTSENAANCLRSWVKYLLVDRSPHWPTAESDTGRTYDEVWLSSLTPPIIGELAYWPLVPDTILVTTVNADASPDSVRVYLCGADIPAEDLIRSAYWHAATSETALDEYIEQYQANGYTLLDTVPCDGSN